MRPTHGPSLTSELVPLQSESAPGESKARDNEQMAPPSSRPQGHGRSGGFGFPTSVEIREWGESLQPDDAVGVARRVARQGRLFLLSALLPVVTAALFTWLLIRFGSDLSDLQYGSLLLFTSSMAFIAILQWRQIAIRLWPAFAIDYYASAVLSRLRGLVVPTATDHAYLAAVLPDLESILVSDVLATRLAGTAVAREEFRRHHAYLAGSFGTTEASLLRSPNPGTTDALRFQMTALLLGTWAHLPLLAATTGPTRLPPIPGQTLLMRTTTALVNKSAESVITSVIAVLGVIASGVAWR